MKLYLEFIDQMLIRWWRNWLEAFNASKIHQNIWFTPYEISFIAENRFTLCYTYDHVLYLHSSQPSSSCNDCRLRLFHHREDHVHIFLRQRFHSCKSRIGHSSMGEDMFVNHSLLDSWSSLDILVPHAEQPAEQKL